MAGTCLFWGKRLCLLALLPVINVPGVGHAVHENSALCSAQRTGTVPHCREENSSRQFHFKLRKVLISGKIIFSSGCRMSLQLLLPVQRSSMYCQQIIPLQSDIRIRVQRIHLSVSPLQGSFSGDGGCSPSPGRGSRLSPELGSQPRARYPTALYPKAWDAQPAAPQQPAPSHPAQSNAVSYKKLE